jgi:hypothetical protein
MALRLSDRIVRGEILNTKDFSTHGWLQLDDLEYPVTIQLTGNCSPDLAGWHIRFVNKKYAEEYNPADENSWEGSDEVEEVVSEFPSDSGKEDTDFSPSDSLPSDFSSIDSPTADSEEEGFDEIPDFIDCEKPDPSGLIRQQIGVTGTMTAERKIQVFDCSPDEFHIRLKLGELPPAESKRCLYLEWFSQNGRVLLEMSDPVIKFVEHVQWPQRKEIDFKIPSEEDEALEFSAEDSVETSRLDNTDIPDGEDVEELDDDIVDFGPDAAEEDEQENPYQLFPPDLQRQLDVQAYHTDWTIEGESDDAEKSDSMREMELMDYLIENSDGEQLDSVCRPPVPLEKLGELSEEEVERALKKVLAQLALYGVALDICPHFTPRMAYRLLVEKIFTENGFFPQLRGTGWVQHYSTWEYCPQCEAELDAKFAESQSSTEEQPEDEEEE